MITDFEGRVFTYSHFVNGVPYGTEIFYEIPGYQDYLDNMQKMSNVGGLPRHIRERTFDLLKPGYLFRHYNNNGRFFLG